jgi:hypothetical protein
MYSNPPACYQQMYGMCTVPSWMHPYFDIAVLIVTYMAEWRDR